MDTTGEPGQLSSWACRGKINQSKEEEDGEGEKREKGIEATNTGNLRGC